MCVKTQTHSRASGWAHKVGVHIRKLGRGGGKVQMWGAAFKELKDGIKQFSQDALKEVSPVFFGSIPLSSRAQHTVC